MLRQAPREVGRMGTHRQKVEVELLDQEIQWRQ